MGGSGGASGFGVGAYGDFNAQHPAGGQGNMIAVTPQMGGYRFRTRGTRRTRRTRGTHRARRSKGGNSRRRKRRHGGTTLTEFAVPAALLFATRFGRRRHNQSSNRSSR